MATSVFLARLLGPLLLLVGAGILFNPNAFRTMASEVVRSVTLVYLFGLIDCAGGLAILLTHNVWIASWPVLITIIGWLMFIRGTLRILIPETVMGYAAKIIIGKQQFIPVAGVVIGLLGLIFCYFGYVA